MRHRRATYATCVVDARRAIDDGVGVRNGKGQDHRDDCVFHVIPPRLIRAVSLIRCCARKNVRQPSHPAPADGRPHLPSPKPHLPCAIHFSENLLFWKIEIGAIIAPMEAIDVGIVRTAAGCPAGQAWPRAFAQFGGGLCQGAAREAFTCKSRDKNLKYLESPAQGLCSVSGGLAGFQSVADHSLGRSEGRECDGKVAASL